MQITDEMVSNFQGFDRKLFSSTLCTLAVDKFSHLVGTLEKLMAPIGYALYCDMCFLFLFN